MFDHIEKYFRSTFSASEELDAYLDECRRIHSLKRSRVQVKQEFGACEGHHIIPKSFDASFIHDKDNLINCRPAEHFTLHRMLLAAVGDHKHLGHKALKACTAFSRDRHGQRILTPEDYEFIRICHVESFSGENNPAFGKPGSFTGKKHTEESRAKLKSAASVRRGKTLEEFYGEEMGARIRADLSKARSVPRGAYSESHKAAIKASLQGKMWITDGVIDKKILIGDPMPEGFQRGRTRGCKDVGFARKPLSAEKQRQAKETSRKSGKKLYTNGVEDGKFVDGEQPEGWWRGSKRMGVKTGRVNTPETIKKMQLSAIKRWEREHADQQS